MVAKQYSINIVICVKFVENYMKTESSAKVSLLQRQVLVGTLLGDAHLRAGTTFHIRHLAQDSS